MAPIDTNSYWIDNTPAPRFSALKEDIAVDVLIVGGGITGITAAYLLKRAGGTVALIEKDRCLGGETSYTTAHLTCVTDTPLSELVKNFGKDHAQAWERSWRPSIRSTGSPGANDWCQFEWVPGYLFNARQRRSAGQEEYARSAAGGQPGERAGFDAQQSSVPVFNQPGERVDNQAKFHPRKYLLALLRLLSTGKGCQVYEGTEMDTIEGTPLTAMTTDGHRIHCEHVLMATHVPRQGKSGFLPATMLQSKLAPYLSYVVGGWEARGSVPEALFWDSGDPYDYLRVDRRADHDFVIFGGEDHKTGQVAETTECFTRLEQRLKKLPPR
jgi:glycine/D-amino acid oxidase-like deaminating enzyme